MAVALVLLQIAALAAVAAANLVPDGAIVDELQLSTKSGAITNTSTTHQRTGGISDHYGECVTFGIGLGEPPEHSWFSVVALSPTLHNCASMFNRLESHAAGNRLTSVPKIRYWNGLSVVARPILATLGVNGLRIFAVLSLLGSGIVLAGVVSRAVGRLSAFALLGPLVIVGNLVGLTEVFHHTLMLSIGLFGVAALAHAASRDLDWRDLALIAFVTGSVYSFVDLMNFVPGLWAMSACVVAACVPASQSLATRSQRMVAAFAAWPAGYLSMWVGKWAWAALASTPSDVLDEIAGQITLRIGGKTQFSSGAFGTGLRRNIGFWLDQALVPAVLVASGVFIAAAIWRAARNDVARLFTAAIIAGPSLILIIWLLVVNSHNEIHYWFEYRSLPMALGVGLMALCAAANINDGAPETAKRRPCHEVAEVS